MAVLLYRLGHFCVRQRRLVLGTWIAVLVVAALWAKSAGGKTVESLSIPGTDYQRASDLLASRFPAQAGSTARVALEVPPGHTLADAEVLPALVKAFQQVLLLPGVVAPSDPASIVTVSPDQRIAFVEIRFDKPASMVPRAEADALIATVRQNVPATVHVAFGGDVIAQTQRGAAPPSELIGFAAAIIILLFTFGSVVAMGLPLLTALVGVGIGILGISVISAYAELNSVAPTLATMIGLAVGIDYALFIVTRHRAFHAAGLSPAESAARANATSGGAVVFAGGTVIIALVGLTIVGIPFLAVMGLCAAGTVAIAVLVAITLVPAVLGFAGGAIDRFALPGMQATTGENADIAHSGSGRFARAITDHAGLYLVLGIVLMAVLTSPLLGIRLGLPDDSSKPTSNTQRQAYDILVRGFGPGFNGPVELVADLRRVADRQAVLTALHDLASADPDVAAVTPPAPNPAGDTAIITVIPRTSPASAQTEQLVKRLRKGLAVPSIASSGVTIYLSGTTAANIDISAKLGTALPRYMAFVIGLTMLLLLVVFRSVLIPIKAAVAILLSIGGALGVVVAVFQWGWLAGLIGVDQTVPIVSFVPLMMFGILFGLSMDYEVFILSRIKEEYSHDGDEHHAVLTGLAGSARVISAAALIMISVFGAFVLGDDVIIKMFGIGLATAVLLDATVVRMVIVPAVMTLLGKAAWWLPRWLRGMPDLDVEGTRLVAHLEPGVAPMRPTQQATSVGLRQD